MNHPLKSQQQNAKTTHTFIHNILYCLFHLYNYSCFTAAFAACCYKNSFSKLQIKHPPKSQQQNAKNQAHIYILYCLYYVCSRLS